MKTLSKSKSDNLGGILNLYLVPADNILTDVVDYSTGIHTITFKNEDDNWKIECSAETVEFLENENDKLGSTFYECELTGFFPNDTEVFDYNRDKLNSDRPWIIIFEDQNERLKMAGANDCSFRIKFSFRTQNEISKLKGYNFSLKADTFNRSVFINNPF